MNAGLSLFLPQYTVHAVACLNILLGVYMNQLKELLIVGLFKTLGSMHLFCIAVDANRQTANEVLV